MDVGRLRWTDAVAGYGLTIAGMLATGVDLRMQWLPGIVASYAAHAWLGAIALYWYFWLRRRFPVGSHPIAGSTATGLAHDGWAIDALEALARPRDEAIRIRSVVE
jgi:hypothetical protein